MLLRWRRRREEQSAAAAEREAEARESLRDEIEAEFPGLQGRIIELYTWLQKRGYIDKRHHVALLLGRIQFRGQP